MIITPYSSTEIVGINDPTWDADDYPSLKFCLPCNEVTGDTVITEKITGATFALSGAGSLKSDKSPGSISFEDGAVLFTKDSTALNDLGGKDMVALVIGKFDTTGVASRIYSLGESSGTDASISIDTDNLGYIYVEDYTNAYRGDFVVGGALADAATGAAGFAFTYNSTIASSTLTAINITSAGVVTTEAGTDTAGVNFTGTLQCEALYMPRSVATTGENYTYGFLIFQFDSLPADWQIACNWMLNDWIANGTSSGLKRIYPGWKGIS